MLSARATAFARVSSSGRSPEVPSGSPGSPWQSVLPASKQQLLLTKRTASGRLPWDAGLVVDAGLARPSDAPQQQQSMKKTGSLRVRASLLRNDANVHTSPQEGSGFVHNALAVGRGLLEKEGLADQPM